MTARSKRLIIIAIVSIALGLVTFLLMRHFEKWSSPPSVNHPASASQLACIAKLPDDTKLAQKIMVAGYTDTLTDQTALFSETSLGGIILMNELPGPTIKSFTDAQRIAPFVATDQEGGTVQRYKSEGPLPGALDMTNFTPEEAYRRYLADDQYLHSAGITTNFAPVVDTAYADNDPLPGRIYSSDPAVVSSYAEQAIRASQAAGMAPVIKHFPGLGSASGNTDFGPATTVDFTSLISKDLLPYQQLSKLHPDVMASNAAIPGLTNGQPASLSRQAITNTLRTKYGYRDAVIYTDSLTAKAISVPVPEATVQAWEAGADVAVIVQLPDQTLDLLPDFVTPVLQAGKAALKSGALDRQELNASVERIFTRKHINACKL